ncbi:Putative membrane protein [Sphingopyxis fribergensis]|uniref:Putative membrane protein n=1 Tax=Sphingopyxis fribergensis TaxID=1515612 RepID=A0A0A7PBX3_9SPHN|nr:hypothetical protein [Sphingopyxis fribergensis]AJA07454.1 Putative membrane protein [Sphingopyxis fribergensis]
MATLAPMTLHISAKTRMASFVLRAFLPLAWLGLISSDRAASFVMRFVRLDARLEGWGGD